MSAAAPVTSRSDKFWILYGSSGVLVAFLPCTPPNTGNPKHAFEDVQEAEGPLVYGLKDHQPPLETRAATFLHPTGNQWGVHRYSTS